MFHSIYYNPLGFSNSLLPSSEMVTLKSSSDSKRPLGVVSGFLISNFSLRVRLFIVWWNRSDITSPVVCLPLQQPLVLRIISRCGQQKIIINNNKSKQQKQKQNLIN